MQFADIHSSFLAVDASTRSETPVTTTYEGLLVARLLAVAYRRSDMARSQVLAQLGHGACTQLSLKLTAASTKNDCIVATRTSNVLPLAILHPQRSRTAHHMATPSIADTRWVTSVVISSIYSGLARHKKGA